MDPSNPKDCAELDLRPIFKRLFPSYGPAWDRAIELGIDVGQLEANLALTPSERLLQLHEMNHVYESCRPAPEHA